jgi:DNA polymerase
MRAITVDFETYYDTDYSLLRLTTEEYIRDPRFEVIGVAVSVDDGRPEWFSGSASDTRAWLEQFRWYDAVAIAHNAVFDMAILSWVFGIRPKIITDTLSMARALHGTEVGGSLAVLAQHYDIGVKGTEVVNAKGKRREDFLPEELSRYGEYCCNDVALTWELFRIMQGHFDKVERSLIDITIRMFTEPKLTINSIALLEHLSGLKRGKEELLERAKLTDRAALMSNPQFAAALEALGVTPPRKISLTTGKETWAFAKSDDAFKKLLHHPNPAVQTLVSARIGLKSTLEETRTQRFIDISGRGLMPVPLRYYAAHTGRWGGDDKLNLQNLPRKSPLKRALLAPEGYVIVDSDSSQIEARTLAWLANQSDLVEAFAKGEDVYSSMARTIFGLPVGGFVSAEQRFVGKITILGCGYGMGDNKFMGMAANFGIRLSEFQAGAIVRAYRLRYPNIVEFWRTAQSTLLSLVEGESVPSTGPIQICGHQGIRLPNGLFLRYPNLTRRERPPGDTELSGGMEFVYDTRRGKQYLQTKIYGGKLVENICQAVARCIIGEQLVKISERYRVVLTVHDAIACIAPEREAEEAKAYVMQCMRQAPQWATGLPLNCEAGYARSYGEC